MSNKRVEEFNELVANKYFVYNSLFLNLPYTRDQETGIFIPLLYKHTKEGLDQKMRPSEILDTFFRRYKQLDNEEDRIDFMFRVIQYVERQIVLYDAVEDAAFGELQRYSTSRRIKDFLNSIEQEEAWEKIAQKLATFSARLVFTAHPTQFYSPATLDIIESLRQLVRDDKITAIDTKLQQLGLTSLINKSKPTPLDEAGNIIYFLRYVYYDALGDLYAEIKDTLKDDEFDNPDIIKLGFWPGGDRDGNPFVTADITRSVADLLRMTLMKCYYKDVKDLQSRLTFKKVQGLLADLREELYDSMFYPDRIVNHVDILNTLSQIKTIIDDQYHGLYRQELQHLIDKVRIFKSHFATLDIRQDHSVHKKLVERILKDRGVIENSIDEIPAEELLAVLEGTELDLQPGQFTDDLMADTVKNIRQLREIQSRNGDAGCNRYIISNSEDIFSVLFVFTLFRWCGWQAEDITFDIVPLFETMKGMDRSDDVMRKLFNYDPYARHLSGRGERHTIMLGFSDGTKDGGYLRANWEIYKTKEKLSRVCKEHNIEAVFFDGRGGPPARGGGKTHRFYASQGPEIQNHEIQLTIQGQTITSIYGTPEQFSHNCEQLLTAGISNELYGEDHRLTKAQEELIEELAQISFTKYDQLKNHEQFIPYLEKKSTLRFYGRTKIGSRPGKRGKSDKLTLADLRAISFVGAWSQLKQNVPGYFGLGTALQDIAEQGREEKLQQLFRESDFFKTLVQNCMMSLTKCYFELTTYMKDDPEFASFWQLLYDEFDLTRQMVLKISGFDHLMQNEEISRLSIRMREDIVLPLLVIQQNALQKLEEKSAFEEAYEKLIVRSLYGNINASRNSV